MKSVKGEYPRSPEIGEVVIVKEENMPRGSWKIARITQLIRSEVDGIARAATLVSSNGREFRRPFRLLYPLEGRFESNAVDRINVDKNIDTGAPLPVPSIPSSTPVTTTSQLTPNSHISPKLTKIVSLPPSSVGDSSSCSKESVREEVAVTKRRPRKCAVEARARIINQCRSLEDIIEE